MRILVLLLLLLPLAAHAQDPAPPLFPFCGPEPAAAPAGPHLRCGTPEWTALGSAVTAHCTAHPSPDCAWLKAHFACTDLEAARKGQVFPENEGDFTDGAGEYASYRVGDRALCKLTTTALQSPTVRYIASNWLAPEDPAVGWAELTFVRTGEMWTVKALEKRPALVSGKPWKNELLKAIKTTCKRHREASTPETEPCAQARAAFTRDLDRALWFHVEHATALQSLLFGPGASCSSVRLVKEKKRWRVADSAMLSCD